MAKKFLDDNFLELLKSKNDIVSVLSKYIKLDRKGKNYWACCPFHHEKSPSFAVNELEQYYYCFGCKENGNVIKFIQKIESCDFYEAVEILAKNVGMEIPDFTGNEDIVKKKKQKDVCLKILQDTYKYYEKNLFSEKAKLAQDYVKSRNLTMRELNTFHIGYSYGYNEVVDYLKGIGYNFVDMQLAGVVEKNDQGSYYDFYAQRLIFPIFNINDECVGFSGRCINGASHAKYKNTSATMLFDKSKLMYGLNIVKKIKQKEGLSKIIIVEGQMDVISMHKAGFTNTIACLGTAFTSEHARQLRFICEDVIVCLDGDFAGTKGALRTIDILVENNFNVKAVLLPENKDPDEYLKEYGVEALKKLLDDAPDFVEFKILLQKEEFNMDKPDEKSKFVNNALEIINTLKTNSSKEVYLNLLKKLSGVPLTVLQRDLTSPSIVEAPASEIKTADSNEDAIIKATKFILSSLLFKKPYANFNFDITCYLKNNSYIKLYNYIKNNRNFLISDIYDEFDIEDEPNILDIINYNLESFGNNERYYDECLWKLVETSLNEKLEILKEAFKNVKDIEQRRSIAKELQEISLKLKNKKLED